MVAQLRFFDLKNKTFFNTDKFTIKTVKGRRFAIAISPDGVRASRVIGKNTKL